jgi:signal peptidase I
VRKIVICLILSIMLLTIIILGACTQPTSSQTPGLAPTQEQPSDPSAQPQSNTEPPANLPSKTLKVSGSAMEPTLYNGDRVEAFSVYRELKRGDIVIFSSPDDSITMMIKRVIGLPGETIQIENGQVLVNGTVQDEPYIKEPVKYSFGPDIIPDNNYFILGDNRNNSSDSHSFGPVPLENILSIIQLK